MPPEQALESVGPLVLKLIGEAVVVTDVDGRIRLLNPAAEEMFGYSVDEVLGRPVEVFIPARYRARHAADVHAFARGEGEARRFMGQRRNVFGLRRSGEEFPVEATLTRQGAPDDVTLAVVLRDVSEQRRLEDELEQGKAAVEESEQRLQLALKGGHMGVWRLELPSGRLELDVAARRLWDIPDDGEVSLRTVFRRVHRDDLAALRGELRKSAEQRLPFRSELRVICANGQLQWRACKGEVVEANDGRSATLMGVTFDITEQREAEELRRTVSAELNHRMRNQMTLVQSVAWLTARDADSVETYRRKLDERLHLLAEEFTLPADGPDFVRELRDLFAIETRSYRRPDGANILLDGPDVALDKTAAVSLRLAVHELATNAAKHGALGAPSGRLRVSWRTEPAGRQERLVLFWEESGGPPVSKPERRGFGSDLIERTICRQLRGDLRMDYRTDGLRCEITFCIGSDLDRASPAPDPARKSA